MSRPDIQFDEGKHRYTVNNESVPSVTQILSIIDKSGALTWWAQGIGVKGVCDLQQRGVEIPWDDHKGVVKLLTKHKLSCNHVRDSAGTRGASLHDALEKWMVEQEVPNPADFPEEDRGYVQALARALLTLHPEVIDTEVMVASVKHGFAGRYDLRARIHGRTALLDLKTSRRIYAQNFLQLEAYELAAVECGDDPSGVRMVLRLGADGEFEVQESKASAEQFLAVLAAWRMWQDVQRLHSRTGRVAA